MRLPNVLAPLQGRSFRLYWGGMLVSSMGDCVQYMAFAWLITELSTKASDLALRHFLVAVPILMLSMKAGELADRFQKRNILIVTCAVLLLITAAISILVYSGRIVLWHVLALAPLLGAAVAFQSPASRAFTAEIVEAPQLSRAVALMHQQMHGARLVGPAIGGLLIRRFDNASAFIANAITYVVALVALLSIRPPPPRAGEPVPRAAPAAGTAWEAVRFVNDDRALRALGIVLVLANALMLPYLTVLAVYYVRHVLGAADAAFVGVFIAIGAGGAVLGAVVLLWGSRATRRWWMLGSVVTSSAMLAALATQPSRTVALFVFGSLSLFLAILGGRLEQVVMERVPKRLLGRVMGLVTIVMVAVTPPCALALSWLADWVGFARVTFYSAVAFALTGGAAILHGWSALASARVAD